MTPVYPQPAPPVISWGVKKLLTVWTNCSFIIYKTMHKLTKKIYMYAIDLYYVKS